MKNQKILFERVPRKKHVRDDGWLVELVSKAYSNEPFDGIHSYAVSIKPGKSRAGHYHNKKEEWLCLVSGIVELILVNPKNEERISIHLDASTEDYCIIRIPKGIAHLVKNPTNSESTLVVFSKEAEDKSDTITYQF